MGKKATERLAESLFGSPPATIDDSAGNKKEVKRNVSNILEQRLEDRRIPKVDDGIRDKDIKNPPPDVVEEWYRDAHVGKYVHMEQVVKDGHTFTTKRVQFEFGRMLSGYSDNLDERGVNPVIERLSFAVMSKVSFINNIANPLRYINYFIEYFDDDDELMRAYFHIMFQIMLDSIDLDPQSFIESTYAAFTTDSMIKKLVRMVEYNTDTSLMKKTDKVYDESIQLTIEHLKAIMGVSCLHKFIIPLVSHYYNTRSKLVEAAHMTDKDLYYYMFSAFIPCFDRVYGINLYNKLYNTSTTRITKTLTRESGMWDRRRRVGTTPISYTNELMRDFVIDISQKAVFSKSAIIFIHVCMDKAIRNTLIQPDKYDYTEMSMEASDSVNEKFSQFDRWQIDKSFHSQRDRIRAYVSIKDALDRFGREVGLDFKRMRSKKPKDIEATKKLREEFAYYRDNIPQPMNDAQLYVIQLYFTSRLSNAEIPRTMEMHDIIKGIMIMKRDFARRNYNYLPFFISGKVDVSAAKKYNRRRVERQIELHPLYDDWMNEYEYTEGLLNKDRMFNEIKTIVACPIVVVDYEHPEMCGQLMRPNEVCVIDEIMRFYCSL